jgi:hypothetical protein
VGELLVTTTDVVQSLAEGADVALTVDDSAGVTLLEGGEGPLDLGSEWA